MMTHVLTCVIPYLKKIQMYKYFIPAVCDYILKIEKHVLISKIFRILMKRLTIRIKQTTKD